MARSTRAIWMAALVVAGAIVLYGMVGTEAQNTSPLGGLTGVIDVVRVFNEYQKSDHLTERLGAEKAELDVEQKAKREAIEYLVVERDSFKRDSEEYRAKNEEMVEQTIGLKAWAEFHEKRLLHEHKALTAVLYEEIEAAVREVARQQGFSLVLYLDGGLIPPPKSLRDFNVLQLRELIRQRKVIYHDPGVDLTNAVLEKLNADFQLSQQ